MAVLPGQLLPSSGYNLESLSSGGLMISALSGHASYLQSILQIYSMSALGYFSDSLSKSSYFQLCNLSIYHDYQSSLRRFFGAQAYQDNEYLYVYLSDLSIENTIDPTAKSLFIALLQHVQKYESNALLSAVYIEMFRVFFEGGSKPKMTFILLINLYVKIVYTSDMFPLFDKKMTNYSTDINPNDFIS